MSLRRELRKKGGFESPHEEAHLNAVRTAAMLSDSLAALLRGYGLSHPTYNILRILRGVRRAPEQGRDWLSCGEIGDRMVVRSPDVTRLADRLVAAGLVTRVRDDNDRRVVHLAITDSGMELLARIDAPLAEHHRATLGHMTDHELSTLSGLLERARSPVSNPQTDEGG